MGAFNHATLAKLKSVMTLETSRELSCSRPYCQAARAKEELLVTRIAFDFSTDSVTISEKSKTSEHDLSVHRYPVKFFQTCESPIVLPAINQ